MHEGAARKAADAAKRGVFTEAAVGKVLLIAHEVRVKAKVRSAGFSMDAVFGEPDSFSFALHVRSTPVGAANLGDEFVERVVADDALMNDPGLTFTVGFRGTTINGSKEQRTT